MWKAFPARLAARTGRRVVAYSRRGYGRSAPRAEPYAHAYMQREGEAVVPAVLAELGIARAVLFGHSDGASIALVAAAEHPMLVEALVLEAPHVFVEDLSVRSIAAARAAWEETDLRARLGRYHDDVDGAFRGWNEIWLSPAFRDWNIEAYAARVRAPMLVIQGEADEYGTRAQVESIAVRAPRVRTCMLAGAGHSPHRDDEGAVLERVAAFLDAPNDAA
ncbi:hydrolase [Vulcanimicrobium alpinum]|uniref:Hydrolase n=2 Tax=Vulcanimicrobium alpinum TaxID=3016050 RepID=A0AAN1XSB5_UNVUL|nr:hydrolase [Vulcanimicrobium alpinum]